MKELPYKNSFSWWKNSDFSSTYRWLTRGCLALNLNDKNQNILLKNYVQSPLLIMIYLKPKIYNIKKCNELMLYANNALSVIRFYFTVIFVFMQTSSNI